MSLLQNIKQHYDRSSLVYDWTFDIPYWSIRKQALSKLDLSRNDIILDVGCGSGVNFKPLLNLTRHNARIYAIDPSYGMLRKAHKKIKRLNAHDNIQLIQASMENISLLPTVTESDQPLKVIMCLSLSVVKDWLGAFNRLYAMLPDRSRIVIMDIFHRPGAFGGAFLDRIASSDTTRPIWQGLEQQCHDFEKIDYQRPFKIFNVSMFVASGSKN